MANTFSIDIANGDCAIDGFVYIATLTWTATDACGNETTLKLFLQVVDTTAPQIMTVPDIMVASCDDPLLIDGTATASDNCDDDIEITYTVDTIITAQDIKYQINWLATDDCLNTDDTIQIITVPCDIQFLFTDISGALIDNTISLNWTAINEDPTGIYSLERSKDGIDFDFLNADIAAEGVIRDYVDYSDLDATPYGGHNYYRVQYIDERGEIHRSDIIRIDLPTTEKVKIFPNPTSDVFTVELNEFSEEEVIVRLHTRDGVTLQEYFIEAGLNTLRVDLGELQSGIYYLTVQSQNTRSHAKPIIKTD